VESRRLRRRTPPVVLTQSRYCQQKNCENQAQHMRSFNRKSRLFVLRECNILDGGSAAMQPPIRRWCHRSFAPECIREMALIGETHLKGNLGEGEPGGNQQLAGTPNSVPANVFRRRNMKIAPERTGKVYGMDSQTICYSSNRDFLCTTN